MEKHESRRYPSVKAVSDADRINMVKEIFATITGKYDFLNRLLSLRQDVAWRRRAVGAMRFFKTRRLLDMATGTGDLAIEAALAHPAIQVIGMDFVGEMMGEARKKIDCKKLSGRISLVQADALRIPAADNSFDVSAIAFGIRNIPERLAALKEMTRVVVPGGRVLVLEMTFPRRLFFQKIYDVYLNRLLPRLARAFSPNPAAYEYLADSIMNFPTAPQFARLMEQAGLTGIEMHPLTFGITYLHVGHKPQMPSRPDREDHKRG